jgi:hypothetical protein
MVKKEHKQMDIRLNKNELDVILSADFVSDIRNIIENSRNNAVRSVDFERVKMYWRLGERILEEEQQGKDRAEYGSYLLRNLAKKIEPEYGSGFSYRQLAFCRQFYRTYPIVNAVRSQFSWSGQGVLLHVSNCVRTADAIQMEDCMI